jgi:uncharacterized membrane protein
VNWLIVALRLLHIVAGVFWAGAAFVMSGFVLPAAAASGPEGGRFVRRLALERGLTRSMIGAGVITVAAGLALLWIDSGGFQAGFMGTGMGVMLSIGGLAALGALATGLRSAAMAFRLGRLAATMEAQGGQPTPEQAGQVQQVQARLAARARAAAVMLAIAVVCMAVARYAAF